MVKVTYYLEVISSWCYWAEPMWAELKRRYEGRVEFDWKIAQMPAEGYPVSKSQCEWFYRRSGSIVRSPLMLNPGWLEPDIKAYVIPNLVAEAARDLGVTDDRARLAIANAAMREGKKVGRLEIAVAAVSEATRLDKAKLAKRAKSAAVAKRCDATTKEFHGLQVTQRPTFLIENGIGDRAVFSGVVRIEPLGAAIEALMADEAAYASWAAHFGSVPAK
jgi:predicted DsbA family dithiol-disulfide isomerase